MEMIRNFFEQLYVLFHRIGFFGSELADYLSGKTCQCDDNDVVITEVDTIWNNSMYWEYGVWAILIPLVVAFLFYRAIDSIMFNKPRHWVIVLASIFVGFLMTGFLSVYDAHNSGVMFNICCEFENVTISDCWGFGFANAIIASLVFIVSSYLFLLVGKSTNCSTCPIKVKNKNKNKK